MRIKDIRHDQDDDRLKIVDKATHSEESMVVWWWLSWIVDDSRAKVDELDSEVSIDDDVFIFYVACKKGRIVRQHRKKKLWNRTRVLLTMTNTHASQIVDDLNNLSKDEAGVFFWQSSMLLNAFKEVARASSQHRRRSSELQRQLRRERSRRTHAGGWTGRKLR